MVIFEYLRLFIKQVVILFIEMAPYLTLGLAIAGLMYIILSKDFVARQIGKNNLLSVFKAAIFGVPLPLCSCGVVPTAVYLKNSGASKPSVTSFLISTPQTGVDSIFATWGMLGPFFAIFRAIAALLIGIAGGAVNYFLDKHTNKTNIENIMPIQIEAVTQDNNGIIKKIQIGFNYAFFILFDDIAVNFLIGLAIAAVISIIIPDNFFADSIASNSLVGMIVMIIIGIPMYICSTASIPIALAFIAKGLSPGAAYVFLVAGPATNAATIAIINKTLGKKTTISYLATIIFGSIIFGFTLDKLYSFFGISPLEASFKHEHTQNASSLLAIGVSIFLLLILIVVITKKIIAKKNYWATQRANQKEENFLDKNVLSKREKMIRINIEGMNCSHCTESVKKSLEGVAGIKNIEVNLTDKYAEVDGEFKIKDAIRAIENAGYKVLAKDC